MDQARDHNKWQKEKVDAQPTMARMTLVMAFHFIQTRWCACSLAKAGEEDQQNPNHCWRIDALVDRVTALQTDDEKTIYNKKFSHFGSWHITTLFMLFI